MPLIEKGFNPFTPDRPVSKERFVGRKLEINRLLQLAQQTALGRSEHVFIAGDYGIGKSSLASYLKNAVERDFGLACFHVYLGNVKSIESFTYNVLESVIEQLHRANLLDKFKDFITKYVKEIDLFSIKLDVDALKMDARDFSGSFLSLLREIHGRLQKDHKGLVLILDDLNGIAREESFANLLKSTVDDNATSNSPIPLYLILCGVEDRRQEIIANHQSVARIFSVVDVKPLDDSSVREFFQRSFAEIGCQIDEDALKVLVDISAGSPRLMHEMGSSVFWALGNEKVITEKHVWIARRNAFNELGRKYFGPLQAVFKTDEYKRILFKLMDYFSSQAGFPEARKFIKSEISASLDTEDKNKLDNFIQKLKRMNVLQPGSIRGEWAFADWLTFWYFQTEVESLKNKE